MAKPGWGKWLRLLKTSSQQWEGSTPSLRPEVSVSIIPLPRVMYPKVLGSHPILNHSGLLKWHFIPTCTATNVYNQVHTHSVPSQGPRLSLIPALPSLSRCAIYLVPETYLDPWLCLMSKDSAFWCHPPHPSSL